MNKTKLIISLAIIVALIAIIYLSIWTRIATINSKTVLDYDPFWFYRHAEDIIKNNYHVPKWDLLSFYPPGRPMEQYQGWPYTIAIMYKVFSGIFKGITLTKVAIISPLIMSALIPIPAFFLGRLLSNNLGGIVTALFASLSPALLGVSMAGYCDTDASVVFWMLFSMLTIFLAIQIYKKSWIKAIPFFILAVAVNIFFIYNWGAGWLPLIIFSAFIPAIIIFRIVEDIIHTGKLKINLTNILPELKQIIIPFLILFILINVIGFILFKVTMFNSLFGGLSFTGITGGRLLVNISVAELQTINIFSKEGFKAVADRVGLVTMLLTLIGLPILVVYKLWKKEKINWVEILMFLWALVMFYLISRGVRFSLLFSMATAVSSGYVIGNLFVYLRKYKLAFTIVFGVIAVLTLMFISNAVQFHYQATGMENSQNWYNAMDWLKANADNNSLVATWWDPGHILAGYTGLKVMADGAHCSPGVCIPYDHNIRIQDMGRIMSTSNESESAQILEKYKELTPQQCLEARQKYDGIMPKDACDPVKDIYLIASADLIGKYYWMSFFGSWNEQNQTGNGRNFIQLSYSGQTSEGLPTYGNGIITLMQQGNQLVAVINVPQQGIRNMFIKDIVYYQNGQELYSQLNDTTNKTINSMLWIDPSFRMVIFMDQSIKNSVFTNLFFFNGNGISEFNIPKLSHFELVYGNSEVKLFKLII
jgi:dolichyl-diphosphooligosaccharide--protein glycosyltransferase